MVIEVDANEHTSASTSRTHSSRLLDWNGTEWNAFDSRFVVGHPAGRR